MSEGLPIQILRCAAAVVRLLAARRLHIDPERVGERIRVLDGRDFLVFRATSCDPPPGEREIGEPVALEVRFRLRFVPPGARIRRYLFERESILNTILYAGAPGYRIKLWLVDPSTSDYAGLYEWQGAAAAERYGRYISAVLRPLSVPGSVGFDLVARSSLDDYLRLRAGGSDAGNQS